MSICLGILHIAYSNTHYFHHITGWIGMRLLKTHRKNVKPQNHFKKIESMNVKTKSHILRTQNTKCNSKDFERQKRMKNISRIQANEWKKRETKYKNNICEKKFHEKTDNSTIPFISLEIMFVSRLHFFFGMNWKKDT